jgi:hypothetical protein
VSAWVVDKAHIDVLVTALHPADQLHGDALGQRLWAENYKSVNYRYDTKTRTPEYRWTKRQVPAVWVLAAAHCYDYQSCEHPSDLTIPPGESAKKI